MGKQNLKNTNQTDHKRLVISIIKVSFLLGIIIGIPLMLVLWTDILTRWKDLDALVGQPLGALEDRGYEMDGWSITEDEAWVFVSSDKVSLRVQLSGVDPDAEPSEWSDEVRRQFPIMKVEFLDFPFSVLAE